MEIIKTDDFEFNDEVYQIVLYRNKNGFMVKAFKNERAVNHYTYSVDFNTDFITEKDYELYYAEKAYERLMQVAKKDIEEGLTFGNKL